RRQEACGGCRPGVAPVTDNRRSGVAGGFPAFGSRRHAVVHLRNLAHRRLCGGVVHVLCPGTSLFGSLSPMGGCVLAIAGEDRLHGWRPATESIDGMGSATLVTLISVRHTAELVLPTQQPSVTSECQGIFGNALLKLGNPASVSPLFDSAASCRPRTSFPTW